MSRSSPGRWAADPPRPWRGAASLFALTILSAACGPARTPPQVSTTTITTPAHAPEIRFALIGETTDQNVWALFAGEDYSYNNYAVRAQYWPRLFEQSVPDRAFAPLTAAGSPTGVRQEGIFHTATVPLRTDLRWTDAAPFTAQDVAFTVNSALEFELGFDWQDSYDPEWLDHAEAVAPDVVKFYFKHAPGVDVWQYGALQGPVVQEHFWSSKVAVAAELLPPDEILATMEALKGNIATLRQEVDRLYAATLSAQGETARQLQADLRRQQGNLDEATNDLEKADAARQQALDDARLALFEQGPEGEPLLGSWLPDTAPSGPKTKAPIVNLPNPDLPGPPANFDRAAYYTYETRQAAMAALDSGEVNVILDPLPGAAGSSPAGMMSPTRSMRFLLFNIGSPGLRDAAFRRALACVVDQNELAGLLGEMAAPLTSFVLQQEGSWLSAEAQLPCAGLDAAARLTEGVAILKARGYTWEREPSGAEPGQGLKRPNGSELPTIRLLAPASDEARNAAAAYVERRGLILGIPLRMQAVTADAINYAVLSSGEYDLAVLGWRLSPYPGYLCDWFGAGGTFHYDPTPVTSLCGELAAASDLERAGELMRGIQRTLAEEVPMLPLFSTVTHESIRGLSYPFTSVLDGLAGVYGAPELAAPAAP